MSSKPLAYSLPLSLFVLIGCAGEPTSLPVTPTLSVGQGQVLLPRQAEVDTSRIIGKFRSRGEGGVFITLTGEPTTLALTELQTAGVAAPVGRSRIVTFDSLKIATIWGHLSARGVHSVALLPYVKRIESSQDLDGIGPQTSSLPVNSTAADITWNLRAVRAPDLWRDFEVTGERQLSTNNWQSAGVMILDIGGDYRQTYAQPNWQFFMAQQAEYNFTADPTPVYLGQHGTDVGSFANGEPDGLWGAGVAPRASVHFYKVLPTGDDWGPIVEGLNQAYADGSSVLNMSIGNCGTLPPQTVHNAISQFTNRVPADAGAPGVGVSLVASAGNGLYSGIGCTSTAVSYPAAYDEVIAVAAIDSNYSRGDWPDLSIGSKIELSAPGICVNGLLVGGGPHECITGTSFSAPHVAGLIAAIRAKNNSWSASYVRTQLQNTATKIPGQALPRDDRYGYGLINVYPLFVPPPPPLTITLTGPSSVRSGATCLWTATPTSGVAPYTYTWNLPNGSSSPEELIFQNQGIAFTVSVTVVDAAGAQGSASKNVTISASAPQCQY